MLSASAHVRLATASDAEAIAAIYAPAVTDEPTSFELTPPDDAEMARRIEKVLARTPWLVFDDGDVLGYAYGGTFRDRPAYQWSVEVSAYVRGDAQRRGIGRLLYSCLFEILIRQGFRNVVAGVTLPNPASVALHEGVGLSYLGRYKGVGYKMGAWHDVGWFERELAPRGSNPPPPVPIGELPPDAVRDAIDAGCRKLGR